MTLSFGTLTFLLLGWCFCAQPVFMGQQTLGSWGLWARRAFVMMAGCILPQCLCAHSIPQGSLAYPLASCGPSTKINDCICVQINELLSHHVDWPEVRGCRCPQHWCHDPHERRLCGQNAMFTLPFFSVQKQQLMGCGISWYGTFGPGEVMVLRIDSAGVFQRF